MKTNTGTDEALRQTFEQTCLPGIADEDFASAYQEEQGRKNCEYVEHFGMANAACQAG